MMLKDFLSVVTALGWQACINIFKIDIQNDRYAVITGVLKYAFLNYVFQHLKYLKSLK